MVNLTSEATWRAPLDELIRVGPFTVNVQLPQMSTRPVARLLVAGTQKAVRVERGMAVIEIESILDHELIVLE